MEKHFWTECKAEGMYTPDMREDHLENAIFKALADPNRRLLLDLLYEEDGRTLSELCAHLNMTRHGVMKHLSVLEATGLITTRKSGREKFHYLNSVPITQIHDRWVSKFAEPWTSGAILKRTSDGCKDK
ncbi:helix-turn-helix transcriptional regulator [Paenibacillus sp. L3-i20]|uniref:ArsR/SmtB family transcription factor n=1 Tax=Paenibacillus sp. L3-i20 TaxID=2905833 RepID=UPI002852BF4D|nr:helix-turn-helix transcriptional regulator [Paenibacillus sp. L3-i20]